MMVVGNKADMKKRAVSKAEGKSLADDFGAGFMEISVSMHRHSKYKRYVTMHTYRTICRPRRTHL